MTAQELAEKHDRVIKPVESEVTPATCTCPPQPPYYNTDPSPYDDWMDCPFHNPQEKPPTACFIEMLRQTKPQPESPLPWVVHDTEILARDGKTDVCGNCYPSNATHIAAAVNAAPVLLARVAELEAQLAAAREAVATDNVMMDSMREFALEDRMQFQALRAQLAAARVAAAEMRQDHRDDCARIILGQWGRECDCGWTETLAARRALGLEE